MATEVKERPILFSAPMVRAILEGRKSQTRRIIEPQPELIFPPDMWQYGDKTFISDEEMRDHLFHEVYGTKGTPYGALYEAGGDKIWVREAWRISTGQQSTHNAVVTYRDEQQKLVYWQDGHRVHDKIGFIPKGTPEAMKWRSPIHMYRWASRITLELTDVRCQRLQEISEEDAIAEGLTIQNGDNSKTGAGYKWQGPGYWDTVSVGEFGPTFHVAATDGICGCKEGERLGLRPARCAFRILWNSIHGDGSWDHNPWLWCLSFKVL